MYSDCTKTGEDFLWCSTKTDGNNKHIHGQWGQCAPPENLDCFKRCADFNRNGKFTNKCKFPFSYKGIMYSDCTKTGENFLWCSTKTDENNKHISGQWGQCALSGNFDCY